MAATATKPNRLRPGGRRALPALAGSAALVVAVCGTICTPPAYAASGSLQVNVPGDPAGWTANPTVPVLHGSNLGPGDAATGTIGIRNSGSQSGLLTVQFTNVVGTLANDLQFSVTTPGGASPSWSGSLKDLESGIVVDPSLPAGHTISWQLTAALPVTADNSEADLTTSFDVALTLSGAGLAGSTGGPATGGPATSGATPGGSSTVVVEGAPAGATTRSTQSTGILSFTGFDARTSLLVASALMALGALVTSLAHRRKKSVA